jgi:hypothetical protein
MKGFKTDLIKIVGVPSTILGMAACLSAASVLTTPAQAADKNQEVNAGGSREAVISRAHRNEHVGGYLIVPHTGNVERQYNAGYSMYVAAWPLLSYYPGHQFQTGLPGTWMFAQYDGAAPKDMYSDVEGGLGWWTDTRFPTTTPKFIMGGVGPNFSEIANGPAHGAGTWEEPHGLYGVAQLSPWVLFPLDGLNVKQGERGGLFGYGYLNLPLSEPKPTTEGKQMPTGDNCWTLFVNTGNFKGPIAFFLPNFWSHAAAREPRLVGELLDSRPMDPKRAVQMETQYTPCHMAPDAHGEWYARIAPISFPLDEHGISVLVHQDTAYNKTALYDAVAAWFAGGNPSSGAIAPKGACQRVFGSQGYATWQIWWNEGDGPEKKVPIDLTSFSTPTAFGPHTFGVQWTGPLTAKADGLVTIPEYFHLENGNDEQQAKWVPVAPGHIPEETGLRQIKWTRPAEAAQEPYTTPDDPASCWKKPGPVAGPFQARLGDGSVVTYYWYRFADQPALLNASFTEDEREQLQQRVEKIHRSWPKDHDYLAPPTAGTLCDLDPALLVTPPKGREIGYVPIATRQEWGGSATHQPGH